MRLLWAVAMLAAHAVHAVDLEAMPVRVLLAEDAESIQLEASATIRFAPESRDFEAPPGRYAIRLVNPVAPVQRVHLFSKSFPSNNADGLTAYVDELRASGHEPVLAQLGMSVQTVSGESWDTRETWVSIERTDSEQNAEIRQQALREAGYYAWIQAETVAPGRGFVVVESEDGAPIASFEAPLAIESDLPIVVLDVNARFDSTEVTNQAYAGTLTAGVGPREGVELVETLTLHDYLRGVLPAELHPSWHPEALRAQAVAIRSNAIASLNGRYALEGFDFFGHERSHAYKGATGWMPETDAAIDATRNEILVHAGRIPQTVFHATCGGWTANNDTVWFGPPQPALRARPDLPPNRADETTSPAADFLAWRSSSHGAYCAFDETYFRWERSYSETELRDMISEHFAVGRIEDIQLGDRGEGGRLKWVRIHGSDATETIHKELPIRRLFGNLPSALFDLDIQRDLSGNRTFTFLGAGRGHGVGLCQNGARGMARAGHNYREILRHYFTNVTVAGSD